MLRRFVLWLLPAVVLLGGCAAKTNSLNDEPGEVAGQSTGVCSVKLLWDANVDGGVTVSYVVSWGTATGVYTASQPAPQVASPAATVNALACPSTYYFVVQAVDAQDVRSTYSNVVKVVFKYAKPQRVIIKMQ